MATEHVYLTTPIYYVNDNPHIGSAYTTVVCDVLARLNRFYGKKVLFLTGTDEHGQKIEKAALAKGQAPQAFVDEVSQKFKDLTQILGCENDIFIRTTEPRHYKAAQSIWQTIFDKGLIYKSTYEGWYAIRDEAFYQESELVDGKAPSGAEVEWVVEESYFFKLSAFQDQLLDFYEKNTGFIMPDSRRNEVISFVKSGLKDLSVSRKSFKWGVPVPNDPDHVMYVWFDALTNYITALGYPDVTSDTFKNFWPQTIHMLGKDILRFHAVYWPAFLMAADLPMPKRIFAHGWWTVEGQKMSKSLGNVVHPSDIINMAGLDALRYFFIREMPLGSDGDFSATALKQRYHSELGNAYGNLAQRVLSFIAKNCESKVPGKHDLHEADQQLLDESMKVFHDIKELVDNQATYKYCEKLLHLVSLANQYVDFQKPWSLRKEDPIRMETVLWVLVQIIKRISFLFQPILIHGAGKILAFLNVPEDQRSSSYYDACLEGGHPISQPEPVFPRLED